MNAVSEPKFSSSQILFFTVGFCLIGSFFGNLIVMVVLHFNQMDMTTILQNFNENSTLAEKKNLINILAINHLSTFLIPGLILALFVYGAILVGFVITNLLLAHLLGPRKHTPVKDMPYESGMDPVGDARQPFDVRFYLVAILFLVFDVELLFLYPWAVSAYSELGIPPELRDTVFAVMLVFMTTLALAWVYAWRKGVFRWR